MSSPARRRALSSTLVVAWLLLVPDAFGQSFLDPPDSELISEGWRGFADLSFLLHGLLTLILATVLGAVIAYHPRTQQAVDTVEEAEAPKIYLTYSVIGAIIGVMVLKFGVVVGFVVFGIGGLIRFRTDLGSATKTGRLIFVTLIGLSCGLNLPHFAVLSAAFGFGLIFLLDARMTYRISVKDLGQETLSEAASAYTRVLEENRCRVLSSKRSFSKGEVTVVFQAPHKLTRKKLDHILERSIPQSMQGAVDWEVS